MCSSDGVLGTCSFAQFVLIFLHLRSIGFKTAGVTREIQMGSDFQKWPHVSQGCVCVCLSRRFLLERGVDFHKERLMERRVTEVGLQSS